MTNGYVYLMLHPAHPELVVVSSASRDPDDPAARSALAPFIVIYSRQTVAESEALKAIIHLLTHDGHAVASHPNYFSCTPTYAITNLIFACDEVAKQFAEHMESSIGESEQTEEEISDSSRDDAEALYYAGCEAAIGSGDALEDHREALRLLGEAAVLGCVRAYDDMGDLYYTSDTVKNQRRAIETWTAGTKLGSAGCWAQLANHYDSDGHAENAKKCWDRFFAMVAQMNSHAVSEVIVHLGRVICDRAAAFFVPHYLPALTPHRAQLCAHMEGVIAVCLERGYQSGVVANRRGLALVVSLTGKR